MAMLMQTLSLDQLGSNGGLERGGLRDPSFSSYLSGAEEGFVLGLVKQSCGGKAAAAADDDGEIGVFGAEKYFNESLNDDNMPKVDDEKKTIQKVQHPIQSKAVSERSGSSWNSQIALLQRSVVKNPSLNGGGKVRGRGYLGSSFRCRCVCSDKNSVAVEEYESCGDVLTQSPTKEPSISKASSVENLPLKPRKSLEVFGNLPVMERPNKPFSFGTEKRLTLNRENEFPRPAESDSDASSDLFEIEDFKGKVNSRNMSGSATPTGNYAPSEASIAWSVVTASAADDPITSAYEELRSGKNTTNSKTGSTLMNKKVTATSDKPRRLSSSFLACNSHDSVKVIEEVHRPYEKIPDTKIIKPQTKAKLTGFEPGRTNVQLGISSRALALSNSINGSDMLSLK